MPPLIEAPTAAVLRERLELLERERVLAEADTLAANGLFMADLHAEIAATRAAYVGAAVTEIASLRASLSGPLRG